MVWLQNTSFYYVKLNPELSWKKQRSTSRHFSPANWI